MKNIVLVVFCFLLCGCSYYFQDEVSEITYSQSEISVSKYKIDQVETPKEIAQTVFNEVHLILKKQDFVKDIKILDFFHDSKLFFELIGFDGFSSEYKTPNLYIVDNMHSGEISNGRFLVTMVRDISQIEDKLSTHKQKYFIIFKKSKKWEIVNIYATPRENGIGYKEVENIWFNEKAEDLGGVILFLDDIKKGEKYGALQGFPEKEEELKTFLKEYKNKKKGVL